MGAYLGFDTEGYFDINVSEVEMNAKKSKTLFERIFKTKPIADDLAKAEDFFKRIIKHKAPLHHQEAHKDANEEAKLITRLRICYKGKIYEINKFKPKMILLPDQKQAEILADIEGLYMKYEYKNPKHFFIYDLKTFMLSGYPPSAWSEKGIVEEKLEPSVGFLHNIGSIHDLDKVTRQILEMSMKHQLVVTLRV